MVCFEVWNLIPNFVTLKRMLMRGILPYIISFALTIVCSPLCVNATEMTDQIETEVQTPSVTVNESGALVVKNAEHMVLEVFAITGEKVYTLRIDSNSKVVENTNMTSGYYIVRIGKFTKKIFIR